MKSRIKVAYFASDDFNDSVTKYFRPSAVESFAKGIEEATRSIVFEITALFSCNVHFSKGMVW